MKNHYSIFTCCKCFWGMTSCQQEVEVPSDQTAQQM